MIEQKNTYENETGQKWPKLRSIFRDFKESHPEFRRNPHLNAKLLESVGPKIAELLNAEAEKLKLEHADLIVQGEKNREAIRAKREEFIAEKQEKRAVSRSNSGSQKRKEARKMFEESVAIREAEIATRYETISGIFQGYTEEQLKEEIALELSKDMSV